MNVIGKIATIDAKIIVVAFLHVRYIVYSDADLYCSRDIVTIFLKCDHILLDKNVIYKKKIQNTRAG